MNDVTHEPQAASTPPYLELRQIKKSFSGFDALRGISLSVNAGEFLCLVGPSGCGKTTLLRCIAGLETQTSGNIVQDSADIGHLPIEQRDFGIVFQSYALFPNLSVWDNIRYGILTKGSIRQTDLQRLEQLLDMVGLSSHRNKYPGQLSGGEQQRVALVRALATSPGLLLLDEPLSALDAQVRHFLRREIKQIQKSLGVTTIMVTHDQEEALSMADRVAVMKGGEIEQIGTPSDIYHKPASCFTANFIGSINMYTGHKVGDDRVSVGDLVLQCPTGQINNDVPVSIGFRPEHVSLSSGNTQADNQLLATVIDRELRGAIVRVFFSLHSLEGEICADLWSGDSALERLVPGTQITLSVSAQAIVVFDEQVS